MSLNTRWKARLRDRARRRNEYRRMKSAHDVGRSVARRWTREQSSVVRPIASALDASLVSVAFRHGLVEGENLADATRLAQCVLTGMSRAARSPSRRLRRFEALANPGLASHRDAAARGVLWLAEQWLADPAGVARVDAETVCKVRRWLEPCAVEASTSRRSER